MRISLRALLPVMALSLTLPPAHAAEETTSNNTISGTIFLPPDLQHELAADDRLVLKLYHPDGGVEKDTRYWIIDRFDLPRDFSVAPSVDMNGKVRWPTYMLEVFTDRDGDVLNAVAGELFVKTDDLIPLGTSGLQLELAPPAR
ncbi:MAG: hypothetical protein ACR2QF_17165 [Geminicoccaceae bacterium]